MLPLARNCRNVVGRLVGSFEIHKHYMDQRFCLKLTQNCCGVAPAEMPSTSKSNSSCSDRGDTFGSLRKPLERTKTKLKSKSDSRKNDVRVIKVKSRPKYDTSNDPDVFGNLSSKNPIWYPEINEDPLTDNDQSDDSEIVRNISKQYRDPDSYLQKMKELVSEKKLKDALHLFIDMKRNFVSPQHAHYTFMIGACGRFGYTEMAFKLLRQMTDRSLRPTPATLTGLFNSCAESPFPDYGLKKAGLLKEKIQTKNWLLNQITYHSMIKAFGKCGDFEMAFQIVDEMAKAKIKIDATTYVFLLMSCVSNKEAGFTHAIEVWRKMKERKCLPNIYTFNLLLRAIRDCEVGPEEISCLLLQHWSSYSKRPYGFKTKETLPKKEMLLLEGSEVKKLDSNSEISTSNETEEEYVLKDPSNLEFEAETKLPQTRPEMFVDKIGSEIPSVLHARPVSCAEITDLGIIKTPSDRLALVGGAENFLIDMKKAKVKPNIKTFTLLLESLPPNTESEEQLMALLDIYGVKPDMGFFNILIKRRNFRLDYVAAHKVLALVNKWSLSPDLITFGVLALGCTNYKKATVFINDMRKLGFSPNIQIVGALMSSACKCLDFKYMGDTLLLIKEQEIELDEKILRKIEDTLETARKNILDMEHGKDVPNIYKSEGFQKNYEEFCKIYEDWLKEMKLERPEHVWNQYSTDIFERTVPVPYNVQF